MPSRSSRTRGRALLHVDVLVRVRFSLSTSRDSYSRVRSAARERETPHTRAVEGRDVRLVCYAPNIAQLNMGLRVRHVGATGKVHHKEDTLYMMMRRHGIRVPYGKAWQVQPRARALWTTCPLPAWLSHRAGKAGRVQSAFRGAMDAQSTLLLLFGFFPVVLSSASDASAFWRTYAYAVCSLCSSTACRLRRAFGLNM